MRKTIFILFLIFGMFLFVSCTNKNENIETELPTKTKTIETESTDNKSKFKLTVSGSHDLLLNLFSYPKSGMYKEGQELIIKANIICDVSLYAYLNNQLLDSYFDSEYNVFKFNMPDHDSTLHFTFDRFYIDREYRFEELNSDISYIKSNKEKIDKVELITLIRDDNIPNLIEHKYSSNQNDIDNVLSIFDNSLIKFIGKLDIYHEVNDTYVIYINDEPFTRLLFVNGLYYYYDFESYQYFAFEKNYNLPTLTNGEITYSFEYDGNEYDVINGESEVIGKYRIVESVEFVEIPMDDEYTKSLYLDCNYGRIYLIDSQKFIYNDKLYSIVNGVDYWVYNIITNE